MAWLSGASSLDRDGSRTLGGDFWVHAPTKDYQSFRAFSQGFVSLDSIHALEDRPHFPALDRNDG
jgi:hypothetical protein